MQDAEASFRTPYSCVLSLESCAMHYTRKVKSGPSAQQKAAALKYNAQADSAPRVKARGVGTVAEKIIQIARDHNVPIREDPDLVELLVQLNLEQEIPPELYKIVAEILAFVYTLEGSNQAF